MRGISRRVATLMFSVLTGLATVDQRCRRRRFFVDNHLDQLHVTALRPRQRTERSAYVADAGAGPTRLQLSNGGDISHGPVDRRH